MESREFAKEMINLGNKIKMTQNRWDIKRKYNCL